MGTKVRGNAFLPEFHSSSDLNGSTSNVVGPTYIENASTLQNGPNFSPIFRKDGYSGRDIEKLRQTMLEHELIFRNQLRELHRLYGRQLELMSEIKSRKLEKDDFLKNKSLPILPPAEDTRSSMNRDPRLFMSSIFLKEANNLGHSDNRDTKLALGDAQTAQPKANSFGFDLDFKRTDLCGDLSISNHGNTRISNDLTLSGGETSRNPCSGFNLMMKDFLQESSDKFGGRNRPNTRGLRNEKNGIEHLSYDSAGFSYGKLPSFEPRRELSHCPYTGTPLSHKKKKIFGVEISQGNEYEFNAAIDASNTSKLENRGENHLINSYHSSRADINGKKSQENGFSRHLDMNRNLLQCQNSTGGNSDNMPCQRTENVPGKYFENSSLMNSNSTDSTSNEDDKKGGLPWFLKNPQNTCDTSKSKKSPYFMNLDSLQDYSEKFPGKAQISENAPPTEDFVGLNNSNGANLRLHIDLNLSADEENNSPLPPAIVKIATLEIDLEAPAINDEPETFRSPKKKPNIIPYEECDKIAAKTIIDMSSPSKHIYSAVEASSNPPSAELLLTWFCDLIFSDQSGPHGQEDDQPVPDGMDYFEYKTLKLKDVRGDGRENLPVSFLSKENPSGGERGGAKSSGRARRGRRARKDFQRDVLPGLVTLSRLEVTEDFQAFEELLNGVEGGGGGQGVRWTGPTRWGPLFRIVRGRRHAGGRNVLPDEKAMGSGWAREYGPRRISRSQERELRGWGKRERRVQRQRCAPSANGFLAFTAKC